MKLKLLDTNEVTLETKDKLCKENISLVVDNTNIAPENIKFGVSILGVNGTYEGSGSSGLETCQVNIADGSATVYYIDATGNSQSFSANATSFTIECAKNSYIFLTKHANMTYTQCTQIYKNLAQRLALYYIYGDATIGQ